MKIYKVKAPSTTYGNDGKLDKYDISRIKKIDGELAIYWYSYGSYEGSGHLLVLKNDHWMHMSLSHCSCYGPVDGDLSVKDFRQAFPSLDDLEKSVSSNYLDKDIKPLVTRARKMGYR